MPRPSKPARSAQAGSPATSCGACSSSRGRGTSAPPLVHRGVSSPIGSGGPALDRREQHVARLGNRRANPARSRCAVGRGLQVLVERHPLGRFESAEHVGRRTRRAAPGRARRVRWAASASAPWIVRKVGRISAASGRATSTSRAPASSSAARSPRHGAHVGRERDQLEVGAEADDEARRGPGGARPATSPSGTSTVAGSAASTPAIASSSSAAPTGRRAIGPGVVERPGQRPGAGRADAAVGRLQPDDAAEAGGHADRAAGVAAERERHLVGRERRRPSRRSSRPEIRSGAHGFRLVPVNSLTEVIPHANSWVWVLPTGIAPRRARARTASRRRRDVAGTRGAVGRPHALRSKRSFTPNGIPSSAAPSPRPRRPRPPASPRARSRQSS